MRASPSASPEPEPELGLFELEKGRNEEEVQLEAQAHHVNAGQLNAADYDPELDRRTSEKTLLNGNTKVEEEEIELIEEEEEEEEEEDVDDMFTIATTEKKTRKVKKVVVRLTKISSGVHQHSSRQQKPAAPALVSTALDNTVDKDGYYNIILGEQIDEGRYQVFSLVGGGTYARVVKARVLQGDAADIGKEVAIKIIRIQELMCAPSIVSSFESNNIVTGIVPGLRRCRPSTDSERRIQKIGSTSFGSSEHSNTAAIFVWSLSP